MVNFAETAVPTTAKPKDFGPFEGKFPLDEGKALTAEIPVTGTETFEGEKYVKGNTEVDTLIKQARNAATDAGVTARQKVESVKQGKKVTALRLTLWTRDKITRPRGNETNAAVEQNADAAVSQENPDTATE